MQQYKNQNSFEATIIYIIFILIAGLVLPALLILLVKLTGHSEVIEEIGKALIILFLILKLPSYKLQISAGIIFGFLFGASESFFYLNNIFQFGDFSILWQRFLWTIPMHIATVLIILAFGAINRKLIIVGLALAIAVHLIFNYLVTGIVWV